MPSSSRIVLGIGERLDDLAESVKGLSYHDWNRGDFVSDFYEVVSDETNQIYFDLTDQFDEPINAWAAVTEGLGGIERSKATSWELCQIYQHSEWWDRITFLLNGHTVPNPFL